jgi:hypothetical protein
MKILRGNSLEFPLKKGHQMVQRDSLCISASVASSWQNFPANPAGKCGR